MMFSFPRISLFVLVGGAVVAAAVSVGRRPVKLPGSTTARATAALPAKLSFNEHVQPILSEHCYQCHGLDSNARKGELRLDREEFAFAPRKNGPIIFKGEPDKSPLVRRIESSKQDEVMPPPEAHTDLKPGEIAILRQWV